MNKQIVSSENVINKSCRKLGISKSAQRWLELAVDPFKDMAIPPEGYPDQIMAPSCVQVVRQKYTVVSSQGTNTWDCNIFMDTAPVQNALSETQSVGNIFQKTGQTGTAYRGGVVVRQGPTGSSLTHVTAPAPTLGLPIDFFNETDTRVVAQGIEIHNVTNELNVSGAVTVWRNPRIKDEGARVAVMVDTLDGSTACIPNTCEWLSLDGPPETVSEATLLPGSRTWEAKKGAYVVPIMANPDNLPSQLNFYQHSSYDDDGTLWATPISKTGANNLITTPLAVNIETPFTMQGAFFTGLDPSTKLVVDAVYVVERFADDLNSDLATLSRPSSTYDAEALKLYSKIAREMPPGVEVGANGFGDWIAGIAGVVSKVAKAASFIPGPIGAIAGGVGAISDLVIDAVDDRPAIPLGITTNYLQSRTPQVVQAHNPQPVVVEQVQPVTFEVSKPQPQKQKVKKPKKPKTIKARGPKLVQGYQNVQPVRYEIVNQSRRTRQIQQRNHMGPRTNDSVQYSTWTAPSFRRRY